MPRIKTELLQEGMVVSSDVRNIDNMLLIPSGCTLTARQINILQAWGVTELDVQTAAATQDTDQLAKLPPEVLTRWTEELKATFWKADEADPVFAEIFKLMLRRRASRGGAK
ncbi:MAG: hypothetical protein U1F83_15015 [Verrucomicrobiota bacterium]